MNYLKANLLNFSFFFAYQQKVIKIDSMKLQTFNCVTLFKCTYGVFQN